jgi:Zn-dependent peptidase ImmA (M78 family)
MNPLTNEPEDFARALRKRFSITGAVDLHDLAGKIGVRIKEVDARGFEGALIRAANKPHGIIALRRAIREPGRKRFTIAHELGHFVLPGHGITGRTCKGENIESKSKRVPAHEAAANMFASELLLPIVEVQPIVQARLASIETAEFLRSKYGTSLTAALLKSSDVANERCCVVVSRDEIIEWAKPNESFKHFIGRRERLSAASLATKLMAGRGEERISGLVPAEVWLDDSHLRPGAMIYEDSVFQAHYNSVLTILTINESLSDGDIEDEESLLSELDPDEFTTDRRRWPTRR